MAGSIKSGMVGTIPTAPGVTGVMTLSVHYYTYQTSLKQTISDNTT